jgi:glycosyltransferase involved in cell wall biosynthesis
VRYCRDKQAEEHWDKTVDYLSHQTGIRLLVRDNTNDNIGLTAARIELLKKSSAEFVCFMDFDFHKLELDLHGMRQMLRGDRALVVPDACCDWGRHDALTASCMMMRRSVYESVGGFDPRFNVAYADWDLFSKVWNAGLSIVRHPGSDLRHAGQSARDPQKPGIWAKDREAYLKKWTTTHVVESAKSTVVLSNPESVSCEKAIRTLHKSGINVCVVNGVHDLNFWNSEFYRFSKAFRLQPRILNNSLFNEACKGRLACETIHQPLSNAAIAVIPVRNAGKYIGECIQSLNAQTFEDLGVILVDDCSTDGTGQIARELLSVKDYIVTSPVERQWAMKNIDMAITELCDNPNSVIFLIDGDDKLTRDTAIEEMMKQHETADLVWSSYKPSDERLIPCSGPLN